MDEDSVVLCPALCLSSGEEEWADMHEVDFLKVCKRIGVEKAGHRLPVWANWRGESRTRNSSFRQDVRILRENICKKEDG